MGNQKETEKEWVTLKYNKLIAVKKRICYMFAVSR